METPFPNGQHTLHPQRRLMSKLADEIGKHRSIAFKVANDVVHDFDTADEVIAEATFRAMNSAASYDAARPVAPWFLRIVRNTALNELKRKRRHCEFPETLPQAGSSADALLQREERIAARELVRSLPHQYREVIALRYGSEMDYKEISDALHIPIGTTKTLLHRAHKVLRKAVTKP